MKFEAPVSSATKLYKNTAREHAEQATKKFAVYAIPTLNKLRVVEVVSILFMDEGPIPSVSTKI